MDDTTFIWCWIIILGGLELFAVGCEEWLHYNLKKLEKAEREAKKK